MRLIKCTNEGLYITDLAVRGDNNGYFREIYNSRKYFHTVSLYV